MSDSVGFINKERVLINFILITIAGLCVGWLANLQIGGKARLHSDLLSGVIGSIFGGCLLLQVPYLGTGFKPELLVASVAGAIMAVYLQRLIRSKRTR